MHSAEDLEKLKELADKVGDVKFAMLTTIGEDGMPHGRPMATQRIQPDGTIWFFSRRSSRKSREIATNGNVTVTYIDPARDLFVSISGKATLREDPDLVHALWTPTMKAWFPGGVEDPEVSLIKVDIVEAEYWDIHSHIMVSMFQLMRSMFKGQAPEDRPNQSEMHQYIKVG